MAASQKPLLTLSTEAEAGRFEKQTFNVGVQRLPEAIRCNDGLGVVWACSSLALNTTASWQPSIHGLAGHFH